MLFCTVCTGLPEIAQNCTAQEPLARLPSTLSSCMTKPTIRKFTGRFWIWGLGFIPPAGAKKGPCKVPLTEANVGFRVSLGGRAWGVTVLVSG